MCLQIMYPRRDTNGLGLGYNQINGDTEYCAFINFSGAGKRV